MQHTTADLLALLREVEEAQRRYSAAVAETHGTHRNADDDLTMLGHIENADDEGALIGTVENAYEAMLLNRKRPSLMDPDGYMWDHHRDETTDALGELGLTRPLWCEDCGARNDAKGLCPSCLPNSERHPDERVED